VRFGDWDPAPLCHWKQTAMQRSDSCFLRQGHCLLPVQGALQLQSSDKGRAQSKI